MKTLLTLLFPVLLFTSFVKAQVYEGYPEIHQYKSRLAKIDEFLQTDPSRCNSELDYLEKEAIRTGNTALQGLTDIYRGTVFYYIGQNDSARVYFESAIGLARKIDNDRLRSSASIRKIFVIDNSADPAILLRMMKDEYEDAKKRKDTSNMIYSLNGLASYYERLDSTSMCINSYMESIKLAQENKKQFEYGFLLNNRGLLKLSLNSPEEARKDLQKGLIIAKKLESSRLEIIIRENLGYYFMEMDSLERAEQEYRYALELSKRKNYSLLWFNSMVNLGVLERVKGNYDKSDSLMWNALELAKDTKLTYAISQIYLSLAQLRMEKKDFPGVEQFLDSAAVYKKYGSPHEIQSGIYQIRYQSLEKQKRFEDALIAYKRFRTFKDSLNNRGHIQLMKEMQLKYDVERAEKEKIEERREFERKLSEEQLNNARLRLNIILVSGIFLVILGGLGIHHYRSRQKKEIEFSNALVNKLEDERSRIARDLHDGLGQSLVILKNKFTRFNPTESGVQHEIDEDFSNVIEEVRSISRSLVPPELRRLGLKPALEKLLLQVHENTGILVNFEICAIKDDEISQMNQVRIYRITQELINNTIKHANATALKVDLELKDEMLRLTYQDNGIGLDFEKSYASDKSLGLKSIEQRVRAMHGQLKFDKVEKGMRVRIKLKSGK